MGQLLVLSATMLCVAGIVAVILKKLDEHYGKPRKPYRIYTDNPSEAVWEANRRPTREIVNICGERKFHKDENGKYRVE